MGIEAGIKQVSDKILNILIKNPKVVDLFFASEYLSPGFPENRTNLELSKKSYQKWLKFEKVEYWKQVFRLQSNKKLVKEKCNQLKRLFIKEWQIAELDLHKYWSEIDFLLTGSSDSHRASTNRTLPLVSKNCDWDNFPLVDAVLCGKNIGYEAGYGEVRYLQPNQVQIVSSGLLELSEIGLKNRYKREAGKTNNLLKYIQWEDEDTEEWLVTVYKELTNYYSDAVKLNNGMLLYFF